MTIEQMMHEGVLYAIIMRGATVYADLNTHTLEEVWNSQMHRQFLDLMFANKRKDIKGCATCSITHTNNDNRYINWIRTVRRMFAKADGYT